MHKIINNLQKDSVYLIEMDGVMKPYRINDIANNGADLILTLRNYMPDHNIDKKLTEYNIKNNSRQLRIKYQTLSNIENVVSEYYGISKDLLLGASRKREIVIPRHVIMFFAYKQTKLTLEKIASKLQRNHASVIHGCKAIKNLYDTDKLFKLEIDEIAEKLNNN